MSIGLPHDNCLRMIATSSIVVISDYLSDLLLPVVFLRKLPAFLCCYHLMSFQSEFHHFFSRKLLVWLQMGTGALAGVLSPNAAATSSFATPS